MSRTTTREIVRVCTEIAKLDKKGKMEVLCYLQDDLASPVSSIKSMLPPDLITKEPKEKEESPNDALIRHGHSCETVI